jgi:hypothetical protein
VTIRPGHTSLHLERGLYLHKQTAYSTHTPSVARKRCWKQPLRSLAAATAETSDLSRSLRSLKPLGHLYRVTQTQAHAESIVQLLCRNFFSKTILILSSIFKIIEANDKMVPALRKILIINPNSTRSMTNALKPLVDSLGYSSVFITWLQTH